MIFEKWNKDKNYKCTLVQQYLKPFWCAFYLHFLLILVFQYSEFISIFFFSSKGRTYKGGLHRYYFWVMGEVNPPSHLCQNCDYMICLTNPQCLLQAAMWHCSAQWDMSQSLQKVSSHVFLALENRYIF